MDINFILSLLFAIPIGIAANLLTPKFQSWMEKKSETGLLRQQNRIKGEYERISSYKSNISDFYIFLLVVSLKITFLYALMSVFNAVITMIPNVFDLYAEVSNTPTMDRGSYSNIYWRVTSVADSLVRLIFILLVFNLCRDALGVAGKVVKFEKYKESIEFDTSSNK